MFLVGRRALPTFSRLRHRTGAWKKWSVAGFSKGDFFAFAERTGLAALSCSSRRGCHPLYVHYLTTVSDDELGLHEAAGEARILGDSLVPLDELPFVAISRAYSSDIRWMFDEAAIMRAVAALRLRHPVRIARRHLTTMRGSHSFGWFPLANRRKRRYSNFEGEGECFEFESDDVKQALAEAPAGDYVRFGDRIGVRGHDINVATRFGSECTTAGLSPADAQMVAARYAHIDADDASKVLWHELIHAWQWEQHEPDFDEIYRDDPVRYEEEARNPETVVKTFRLSIPLTSYY
jgi:hypothetical protein